MSSVPSSHESARAKFKVGDLWIYTTPSGREILHKVTAVNVKPKHQHKPGNCVRLVAVEGRIPDAVMWPEDILAVDWMRPAPPRRRASSPPDEPPYSVAFREESS